MRCIDAALRWYLEKQVSARHHIELYCSSVSLRVGICLSKCSFRVKLFPQYAQNTMLAVLYLLS
jgi:hypothetical protein